jgi:YggT family protein
MISRIIGALCDVLTFAIVARALLSWFPIRYDNPVVVFLNQITEPFLLPLRRVIPRIGPVDITPLIAVIVLQIIRAVI